MPESVVDVAVVGAGPAGAAAAIHLARSGQSVVLIDKAQFPRDKCCGDGITTLALRELDHVGFDPGTVVDWFDVDAAWLRSPKGREIRVPLPAGNGIYAAVAPRVQFDAALVDLAKGAGADVRLGAGFARFDQRPDGAPSAPTVVLLDDGTLVSARSVIAADGMWSPVRRAVGANEEGYLGEWHAFRQYVGSVTGPAANRLYVWFDPDLLPGYAWSFPLPGGRANVGFGVLRADGRSGRDVKELWRGLIDRPHVREALGPEATAEGRHLAWPIPAGIDRAVLHRDRVLFVGDAAMASDVMTGEGIGQALLSGRLAAEAIAAGNGDGAGAGERYARSVRHELVADHRMSALLVRVFARRRGAEAALAIVAYSGEWGRRNFARWMFEDEPRAIAVTPRRWHRKVLRRPGVFAT